jgi:hypothetical protein
LCNWAERQKDIADLPERQLFFIGGVLRSGTTGCSKFWMPIPM